MVHAALEVTVDPRGRRDLRRVKHLTALILELRVIILLVACVLLIAGSLALRLGLGVVDLARVEDFSVAVLARASFGGSGAQLAVVFGLLLLRQIRFGLSLAAHSLRSRLGAAAAGGRAVLAFPRAVVLPWPAAAAAPRAALRLGIVVALDV